MTLRPMDIVMAIPIVVLALVAVGAPLYLLATDHKTFAIILGISIALVWFFRACDYFSKRFP
jgi:hypothetical protein